MAETVDEASLGKTAFIATAIAILDVLVAFGIARLLDQSFIVRPEFGSGSASELQVWVVAGATALGGIAGLILAVVSKRFGAQATMVFLAASLLGLVAYGVLSFIRADATSTALWLNALHLVAAVPIVGLLANELNRRAASLQGGE